MTAGPSVPGPPFGLRLPAWLPLGLEHRPVIVLATLGWIVVSALSLLSGASWSTAVLIGWNLAALFHIACSLRLMRAATPDSAHRRAATLEDGRVGVLVYALAAVGASVLAMGADLAERHGGPWGPVLAFATLGVSWAFMQVLFAHQYLHEHWRDPDAPGFDIPGDPPDAWDFLYLAATLGATFQVSDITPLRRRVRRLLLVHSVTGWLFTVIVLSAAVNLSSSLIQ